MASSSSKRKHAGRHEKVADLAKDAQDKFMRINGIKMTEDADVITKFLIDQTTKAIIHLQSVLPSTKQEKVTKDQITGEITTCDPKHEDGYKWVKYGKKNIKKFNDNPKDYYHCSNKHKNGCPAKRHVQQLNSQKYHRIYYERHTCGGPGGIQNQKQQQHSPPLDPSEHGSASTMQIPNSSSSISATPSPEPAGQNDEDDGHLTSQNDEVDIIFASFPAGQNYSIGAQFQKALEEFKKDVLWN